MKDTDLHIPKGSINVNDLDLIKLIKELCNNTETVDTPYCREHHKIIDRDVTIEEVKEELEDSKAYLPQSAIPWIPDYMFGRSIKAHLRRGPDGEIYLLRCDLYDRDSTPGNAQRIVNQLRKQEQQI